MASHWAISSLEQYFDLNSTLQLSRVCKFLLRVDQIREEILELEKNLSGATRLFPKSTDLEDFHIFVFK